MFCCHDNKQVMRLLHVDVRQIESPKWQLMLAFRRTRDRKRNRHGERWTECVMEGTEDRRHVGVVRKVTDVKAFRPTLRRHRHWA